MYIESTFLLKPEGFNFIHDRSTFTSLPTIHTKQIKSGNTKLKSTTKICKGCFSHVWCQFVWSFMEDNRHRLSASLWYRKKCIFGLQKKKKFKFPKQKNAL